MYALLSRRYYLPKMEDDIKAYIRTCLVCQLDKLERKKEAGLLQPLPIIVKQFQSVSMDFISGFSKVDGITSFLVVVDRFLKNGIFIAASNACPAEVAADLFMKYVVKYFGVSKDIISDQDTRFTGQFWTTLFNMICTELKLSMANHPQTDGQMKRMNQLLEEHLRHYVSASQKDCMGLLEITQFSYNVHARRLQG